MQLFHINALQAIQEGKDTIFSGKVFQVFWNSIDRVHAKRDYDNGKCL